MKHILLLTVMLALVFGSSAAPTETRVISDSGVSANAEDVEGVIIEDQQLARLKPGYKFRRKSRSSVSVLKTIRNASLQMGTLTCTSPGRTCIVQFGGNKATCRGDCYFVGVSGGILAR